MDTSTRKLEHLEIVLEEKVEGFIPTWFEHVYLPHRALPEIDFEEISLETRFLGKRLKAPLIVEGMTGGHPVAKEINARIAESVEELGLAMGVGSQRAAIEDPGLEDTYRVVRKYAPTSVIIANIGAAQLNKGYGVKELEKAVEMIEADAIAVHLNPAQEVFQREGDKSFKGIADKLAELAPKLSVPVIVKETGSGLSKEDVARLYARGIKFFDVAGSGGTSWIAVEMYRNRRSGDEFLEKAAEDFLEWGIPTAASIIEARVAAPKSVIIASGGIRTGVHVAKALALGADLAGLAAPVLRAFRESRVKEYLTRILYEVKAAAFLTGSRNVEELKSVQPVLTGPLREWIEARGLTPTLIRMVE